MNSIASRIRRLPLAVGAAALVGCGVEQIPAEPHPTAGQVLAGTHGPDGPWLGLGPVAIAVDSTTVYAATAGMNPLLAIPVQGGEASPVGVMADSSVAVDEQRLYWADDAGVGSCNKLDCAGSTRMTPMPYGVASLTLDASHVYFTDRFANMGQSRIMKMGKDGSSPVELAVGYAASRIAVDAENLYWLNIVTDASCVMKTPLTGGPTVQLATESEYALNVAIDADNIYITTDGGGGTLRKVSKNGGPTSVLATGLGLVLDGLRTDGKNVYVGAGGHGPGTLVRVPVDGGPAHTLVSGLGGSTEIVLDDSFVYLADRSGYQVVKVEK